MSWMDSWSRPSKHAVIPPPLYLLPGGDSTPYCRSCGRVISSRKTHSSAAKMEVRYCSDRCRHHKPGKLDYQIEETFVSLLNGQLPKLPTVVSETSDVKPEPEKEAVLQKALQKKKAKGDPRLMIPCSTVETLIFGSRNDPGKVYGRKRNRAARGIVDAAEWKSVDMEPHAQKSDVSRTPVTASNLDRHDGSSESEESSTHSDKDFIPFGAGKVRPPQSQSEVNGSVGGEKGWAERQEETEEAEEKRKEGQRWVERKEMIRAAARRGVVFGFVVKGEGGGEEVPRETGKKGRRKEEERIEKGEVGERRRKCEAIMNEAVVEPSFAKGDWGIRWRE